MLRWNRMTISNWLSAVQRHSDYIRRFWHDHKVLLTFDDGPHPISTPRIINTLDKYGIKATFFVRGNRAERFPDVLRMAFDSGHRIGNHTYSHPNLTTLSHARIREEIQRTHDIISPFLTEKRVFRPPHGERNRRVDRIATELGYETMLWNVSTRDWRDNYKSGLWVTHACRYIRLGGLCTVLLHDDQDGTAEHMEEFIRTIQAIDSTAFAKPEPVQPFCAASAAWPQKRI
jgi:peptidoglycan-N-acetylglucosamine deacetylase